MYVFCLKEYIGLHRKIWSHKLAIQWCKTYKLKRAPRHIYIWPTLTLKLGYLLSILESLSPKFRDNQKKSKKYFFARAPYQRSCNHWKWRRTGAIGPTGAPAPSQPIRGGARTVEVGETDAMDVDDRTNGGRLVGSRTIGCDAVGNGRQRQWVSLATTIAGRETPRPPWSHPSQSRPPNHVHSVDHDHVCSVNHARQDHKDHDHSFGDGKTGRAGREQQERASGDDGIASGVMASVRTAMDISVMDKRIPKERSSH